MIGYRVDRRDEVAARHFIEDLSKRLANRVQLTMDGLRAYLVAVPQALGKDIDYGMLTKLYSNPPKGDAATRYSPGECCGTKRKRVIGKPAPAGISTSYVECQT